MRVHLKNWFTFILSLVAFLTSCQRNDPVPQLVISSTNEILEYSSRKPMSWDGLELANVGCSHCFHRDNEHGSCLIPPSLVIHHDKGSSVEGLNAVLMHTGMARIAIAFEGELYDVFSYSPPEYEIEIEEIEEIEEEIENAADKVQEPSQTDNTSPEEPTDFSGPACFEVVLIQGRLIYPKSTLNLAASYRNYLLERPKEPIAYIKATRLDSLQSL